jgi:hypothetical protein
VLPTDVAHRLVDGEVDVLVEIGGSEFDRERRTTAMAVGREVDGFDEMGAHFIASM